MLQIPGADRAVETESSRIDFLSTLWIFYQLRQQLAFCLPSKVSTLQRQSENTHCKQQHTLRRGSHLGRKGSFSTSYQVGSVDPGLVHRPAQDTHVHLSLTALGNWVLCKLALKFLYIKQFFSKKSTNLTTQKRHAENMITPCRKTSSNTTWNLLATRLIIVPVWNYIELFPYDLM